MMLHRLKMGSSRAGTSSHAQTTVALLCLLFLHVSTGFNLEPRLPVIKRGVIDSYFGYSVAEHLTLDESRGGVQSVSGAVMLVGAPRGQSSQPGTNRSGVVYKCVLNTIQNDCKPIKIDQDDFPPEDNVSKDNQWLGVTVKSQGPGGYVMACAHRYVLKGKDFQWGQGICYSLSQYLDYKRAWEPCFNRPVNMAHEQYGYCQAGTSGDISEDHEIVIGTPGPYTWRGTLFTNSIQFRIRDDKTWYLGPLLEHQSPVDKYSYLGMSTVTGRFFGSKMNYVGGAPRANGTGQVLFFSKQNRNSTLLVDAILNGEQFASSFGYTMATIDCNNDNHLDLVVSAPFYYNRSEGGAVYIYLNQNKGRESFSNTPTLKLTGNPESRFGFALANLGDLNKDGYNDLAIGAPYDEGGGAIYIYLGSEQGLRPEPTQIIKGRDIADVKGRITRKLTTFGYSLSGSLDLDQNGYPDLLVGAYDSDAIFLLRARPILDIVTSVSMKFPENLNSINPYARGCAEDRYSKFVCFSVQACFRLNSTYSSTGSSIRLRYRIEAETYTGKKYYRAQFNSSALSDNPNIVEQQIVLRGGSALRNEHCKKELVHIKDVSDIQSPIKFKLTYSLIQREPEMPKEGAALPDINRYPILNQEEAHKEFDARFLKDCGSNDVCESHLAVTAELHLPVEGLEKTLYLGEENVNITMKIENKNEPAYDANVYITHPASLSYVGRNHIRGDQIECVPQNVTIVRCELGNPFNKGETELQLRFNPKGILDDESRIEIKIEANTTSNDVSPDENSVNLEAKIIRIAELELRGNAEPDQVFYGGEIKGESAMEYEEDIGSLVTHSYVVTNRGPWRAKRVEVIIDWPFEVQNGDQDHGKWLLYMIDIPKVQGVGYCEPLKDDNINPLGIKKRDQVENLQRNTANTRKSRRKREARPISQDLTSGKPPVVMDCKRKTARCFRLSCYIQDLYADQTAVIKIRARLWNSTFVQDYAYGVNQVHIVSHAKLRLDPALDIIQQRTDNDFAAAKTKAYPDLPLLPPQQISLWIYILAVTLGIILLVILTLILWKIGFFKRKKPGYIPAETDDKEVYHYG